MFDRVLVANRTEIAVRVMQACEELDIETIAVYSDPDQNGKHVRYADEAYRVGPAKPAESYLDQEAILGAAERADADAIHPGYGFLAENPSFAEKVEDSDVVWIGPPSDAMRRFGEKTRARQIMEGASVPTIPGTTEPISDPDRVRSFAAEHGYPVAIKAVSGGGGRGLKIVRGEDEVEQTLDNAIREADAYFDNPEVYLERYLEQPKHVEVQILADEYGNVRHLGERDCTMQRRQQKLIEETPSPALDEQLRQEIGDAARRGTDEANYVNAGTVEFLVEDGEFFFIEVNTRIQVEHTITEIATGIDIVKWQIRIAAGEELTFKQADVTLDRAAMEYRVNAEDPANDFMPTPGELTTYNKPSGIGVRIDDGFEVGDDVNPYYDSMVGKLIVSGESREEVIARSKRVLKNTEIEGISTTIPFHVGILSDDVFVESNHSTKYIDEDLDLESVVQSES